MTLKRRIAPTKKPLEPEGTPRYVLFLLLKPFCHDETTKSGQHEGHLQVQEVFGVTILESLLKKSKEHMNVIKKVLINYYYYYYLFLL